jgi:hypothetical protein
VIAALGAVLTATLAVSMSVAGAAPKDEETLAAALLTQSDVPAGWIAVGGGPAGLAPGIDACTAVYKADAKAQKIAEIDQTETFADPAAAQVANLSDRAYVFPSAKKAKKYVKAYTKATDAPNCIAGQAEAALSEQVPEGMEVAVQVAGAQSVDLGDQALRFDADYTATLNGTPVISAVGSFLVVRVGNTVMEFQVTQPTRPFDPAVDAAIETVVTRVTDL